MIWGVDPGKSGALALLGDGEPKLWDMPTLGKGSKKEVDGFALRKILSEAPEAPLALERPISMVGQATRSALSQGCNWGVVYGVSMAMGHPIHHVWPATWKKSMGLSGKAKDISRQMAIEMFPAARDQLKLKKHVDRADALLIAEFQRRKLQGE